MEHVNGTSRRRFVGAAAAASAVPAIGSHTVANAAENWRLYIFLPSPTMNTSQGLSKMAERLQAESNGELNVRFHVGGSLQIPVTNMTSAVADGVVQFGDDGFYHGTFPWGGAIRLPMLVQTEEEFAQAQQIMRPYLESAYLKKGVLLLAQYAYPAQVGFSRRKLTSLEDYKGQKLRVSSAEQGEFVRTFGGVPVTLGTPEVPSSLDRGVIDGVFTSAAPGGWSWRESLKFNYRLVIGFFDANLIVNKAAFDKLSPAMQQKMRTIVTETAPTLSAVMKRDDDATIEQLKSVMTVSMAGADEVKRATAAMAPYWDSWARTKGPEAVEIVGKLRAAFKR